MSFKDGRIIIDWGDGLYQDVQTGSFQKGNPLVLSFPVADGDLENLVKMGIVKGNDTHQVFFSSLPDRPMTPLE